MTNTGNYYNWGLDHFDFRTLRKKYHVSGKGIKVLVIDSGQLPDGTTCVSVDLCTTKGDAIDRLIRERPSPSEKIAIFSADEFANLSPVTSDVSNGRHGSEINRIIASNDITRGREGIAPDCELLLANVFNSEGQLEPMKITTAIYWGLFKGVDIINISQQVTYCDCELNIAVVEAFMRCVPIVCGTGNSDEGDYMTIEYPAAFQKTFGIGSMAKTGSPTKDTDKGQLLDFLAPGSELEPYYSGNSYLSGSSYAAPFFTGILALFFESWLRKKSARPSIPYLKRLIIENTTRSQFDINTGYGAVNADKLLANWDKQTITLSDPALTSIVKEYLRKQKIAGKSIEGIKNKKLSNFNILINIP